VGRGTPDVVAASDQRERQYAHRRDARDRADLDAVDDERVAADRTGRKVDDAQRHRRVGAAAVHALDEFLARITPLREVDRHGHHAGHRRDRLAGHDLRPHPRPTGGDTGGFVFVRRGRRGRGHHRDLRLDPDLEPVQPGRERLAESGIGVEVEAVVAGPGHPGERLDLARRFEHERPRGRTDVEPTHILRDLRMQVGEGVRSLDDHMVAGTLVDCCGVWSHTASLPWHTAIVMTYDDDTSDGRLHDLATRAVDSLLTLVQRGTRLAFGTLLIVVVVCVGGFALGIAALSDGIETVWIIFGGFAAFVAIGSVMLAMFRLWAITKLGTALVTDVQRLIAGDPRSERVVIETVEASDGVQDQSAMVMSRQFFTMNDTVVKAGQFSALAVALKSVTTFPLLMLLATVITAGFAGLSLLFLLGLVL
jgi:hypothetical protein